MGVKNRDSVRVRTYMQIFGIDIQAIYLFGLIVGGSLTILYMFFGDVFEVIGGIGDVAPGSILNPTVILSFFSVLCGAGYVLEIRDDYAGITNLLLAILLALIVVSIIHFFILVPLAKSEESTARSIGDFLHREGEVITTIPADGIGEVLFTTKLGVSGQIAKSASEKAIAQGTIVTVRAIKPNGVFIVEPLEKNT